jgi:glutamyl-tRNA reductase
MTLVSKFVDIINFRITYKRAAIHLLEKFSFKDISTTHKYFLENFKIKECLILQTCNRVEIFIIADNHLEIESILEFWAHNSGLSVEKFSEIIIIERGEDVIRHLLKLVSGLDSLVLGEDQILGQVRRSYELSRSNNYIGNVLSTIFEKSVRVGSKVRYLTGINKGSVSVGSVAVNLAEDNLEKLNDKKILLIGSGEGASLVAKALKQRRVCFMNTSRTFERGKSFAEAMGGNPILFEDVLPVLGEMDLIFISTTAPYYLLTYDRIKTAMNSRTKPLLIFDLSNPRTVEELCSSIPNVTLFNMDQIGNIVKRNITFRSKEIQSAEYIIEDEIKNIVTLLKRKKADPVVISVFRDVDKIRERELKKALSILGKNISPNEIKIIEQFSHALLEGIISTPMNNLRRQIQSDKNDAQEIMRIAAKLFNYDNETSN